MERAPRTLLAAALVVFLAFAVAPTRADTYAVTNKNATGPGSLLQAIFDANAHAGQDTVSFNIPGSGVHRIDLTTMLPEITDSVIVDGYTQPGAHPNTLSVGNNAVILIHLNRGPAPAGYDGVTITGGNSVIRGLAITGFAFNPNPDPSSGPTGGFGINVKGPGTGNVIEGNFIGLNPDGVTAYGNLIGIRVGLASQTTIGGANPAARNVISGNVKGIALYNGNAGSGMVVSGNYIGTDASGTRAVGNEFGIDQGASDSVVGGTAPFAGNVISGNRYNAINLGVSLGYRIIGHADRVLVQGNLIGTSADGARPLGNGSVGIYFLRSSNSTIGGLEPGAGNVIAHNDDGIIVNGSGNSILSNSIYGNNGRGIILYGNPANYGFSAPVITSETISRGVATISGTLQSAANTQFLVQFFADSQSLTTSEQTFVGSANVTTNSSGFGAFTAKFPVSDNNVVFNATATAPTAPNGSTSEFARNPVYLQNLSARAVVGTGDDALIGGLIIGGSGETAVRGIGPSLKAFGLNDALADPTLEFRDSTGKQMVNDNWKDSQQASSLQQKGLAPSDDLEAAMLPFTGPAGVFIRLGNFTPYTAILRGKGGTTGIGVVEAYALPAQIDSDFFPRLANLSARGLVGASDKLIFGGFILGGGDESTRVVVRAIGPSLQTAGVPNPLLDPVLELHDSNGLTIKSNDNWEQTQANDLRTVGLAPTNAAESAILTRLIPGAYTAVVRGKGNATGVALVEIYRLP